MNNNMFRRNAAWNEQLLSSPPPSQPRNRVDDVSTETTAGPSKRPNEEGEEPLEDVPQKKKLRTRKGKAKAT